MKTIGITSTAILSLLLGMSAPAYAQHEEQGEHQDEVWQVGGEQTKDALHDSSHHELC